MARESNEGPDSEEGDELKISIGLSREERARFREVLQRSGASNVAFSSQENLGFVSFTLCEKPIRFPVPLPETLKMKGKDPESPWEAECGVTWGIVREALVGKITLVNARIATVEDEFSARFVKLETTDE